MIADIILYGSQIGTLLSHILIASIILIFIRENMLKKKIKSFFQKFGLHVAFGVSVIATMSSLGYSEILNYSPCLLCWYQRIFMFPLPIILFTALIIKDKAVSKYVIPLASIGGTFALYHYLTQMFSIASMCAVGELACTTMYTLGFGYITIPLMALTAFIIIIFSVYQYKRK